MIKSIFTTLCLLTSISVFATNLPEQSSVPGGLVIVPLSSAGEAKPAVTYNKKPVMVVEDNEQWLAIVGVPLKAKAGTQYIKVNAKKVGFNIVDKAYPTQHITITNKRKVNPNKLDMDRINAERANINAALRSWTEQEEIPFNFIWPIEGRVSGLFGRRRVFNDQPRRPHSGMDIAAPTGTQIHAPAAGVIKGTGNYFFNGNTVFIDHGQGLVTMFCHMDQIDVQDEQIIQQGDIIGTVGMTGRVTGPHLHLGVSLNDTRIEPRLFFPEREAVEGDEQE